MIQEIIVTTQNEDGTTHIAPMGIREEKGLIIIAPFKPSATLENIQRNKSAVVNRIDDVRIFSGCLTGRKDWPLVPTDKVLGKRLQAALSHLELELDSVEDDDLRPRFYLKPVIEVTHSAFKGFNRAQSAVLEAAILVSRLKMLSKEKVEQELEYLTIAIDKTAGENEKIAWQWLMEKIDSFQKETKESETA
ncbi:MAG TPA: DUF447 family protein [Thiotrichaceae bacterium]|jgi:hypothetical protein|nr:DUF447 family protein [Thiotrichaceae bacterium]HIM06987.1 DUF447 family protein [Gammaproteobacteria bacterium]